MLEELDTGFKLSGLVSGHCLLLLPISRDVSSGLVVSTRSMFYLQVAHCTHSLRACSF